MLWFQSSSSILNVTVLCFIFLDSKITADGDCSYEIKRFLLLGIKAITNLDSILKSRDLTLPTKVCPVKAMFFSQKSCMDVSWTIKKAEHQGIDAFEWWCWITHLRVPWTARRSTSQSWRKSILSIHWRDWCWGWSSNTWPPDAKSQLIGNDPDAGKDWRQEEKGTTKDEMVGWHHWLNGHKFEQAPGDSERQGSLACCRPWGRRVGQGWATEQQHNIAILVTINNHLVKT